MNMVASLDQIILLILDNLKLISSQKVPIVKYKTWVSIVPNKEAFIVTSWESWDK